MVWVVIKGDNIIMMAVISDAAQESDGRGDVTTRASVVVVVVVVPAYLPACLLVWVSLRC